MNGYNPAQLTRFWSFVRASEHKTITYNQAFFSQPPRIALDLLQIGWVVTRSDDAPPVTGAEPVAGEGWWRLWRLPNAPSRASLVFGSVAFPDAESALREVVSPSFDPARSVVVEAPPSIGSGRSAPPARRATYRQIDAESAEVVTDADRPATLVVRNTFDPYWRATVDGRPTPVFAADYLVQGVRVPTGRHVVRLEYRDPTIGAGIAGSVLALALLLVPAAWVARRHRADRKRESSSSSESDESSSPSARA